MLVSCIYHFLTAIAALIKAEMVVCVLSLGLPALMYVVAVWLYRKQRPWKTTAFAWAYVAICGITLPYQFVSGQQDPVPFRDGGFQEVVYTIPNPLPEDALKLVTTQGMIYAALFTGEYAWQHDLAFWIDDEIKTKDQIVWGMTNDGEEFTFQPTIVSEKTDWSDTDLGNDPNWSVNEHAQVAVKGGQGWLMTGNGQIPIWFLSYSITLETGERASYLIPGAIDMVEGSFDVRGEDNID